MDRKDAPHLESARHAAVGLDGEEAARRLAADGPNELAAQGPRALLAIAREVLTEPMFLLLLAAASIYLVLGDVREALVLAASIMVIVAITMEWPSEASSARVPPARISASSGCA